jgi:hypothetical protein
MHGYERSSTTINCLSDMLSTIFPHFQNGGGGRDKEMVNSTNLHFPLIYLPRWRNVG